MQNVGGGNPGSYLRVCDTLAGGGGLFVRAPSPFVGDLTGTLGSQYDALVFDRGGATQGVPEVFIHGGPNSTTYRPAAPMPLIVDQWHTIFHEFKAQNFALSGLLGGGGADPFEDVLSDVNGIFISMDVSTTTGFESGIDNVFLRAVPEPSSFAMFGISVFTLICCLRRTQS